MTREYKGEQRRDWHDGNNALNNTASHAVAFAALSNLSGARAYQNLTSKEEREGFFDTLISNTQGATTNWAQFYALVDLMRTEEWYWKAEGYDDFYTFWHAKTGDAFARLEDLETVYNFAKTANPDLFNVDWEEAKKNITEADLQIGRLIHVPAATRDNKPGSIKGEKRGPYKTKKEVTDMVTEAAAYKPPAGNSVERRFMKLRRDNPDVAAGVLAGEYIKVKGDGFVLDMNAAEKVAFGKSNSEIRKEKKEAKQKKSDLELLETLLKTRSVSRQETVIEAVKSCDWLMEAIK